MAETGGGDSLQRNVVINTTINNAELSTGVAEANSEINKIGKGSGIDAGTNAVKSFKAQLKEAKEAAIQLRLEGKTNTQQYRDQLAIISNLTDEMQTLGRATAAFDPGNRFQALNKVASLAAGSLGALQGTFTLLGVSADTANESIAKLQSIQAIIGLLDNFGDAMDVLHPFLDNLLATNVAVTEQAVVVEASTIAQAENVAVTGAQVVATEAQTVAVTEVAVATEGATIVTKLFNLALKNLPFILIATAIISVVAGFIKFKKQIFEAIPFLKDLADITGKVITSFTDFVGITSEAERASEAFSIAMKKANSELEYQNKLLGVKGNSERQIYLNSRKILDNTISDLKLKAKAENEYNQEYYDGLNKAVQDRNILDAGEQKRLDTITEKRKADAKKKIDEANKNAKTLRDEANKNNDDALKLIQKAYQTERYNEELAITDNYKAKLITAKKAYGANSAQVKNLLDAQATELGEVKTRYDEILDKAFKEQNDKALTSYDTRIQALQEKYNEIRKNNPEKADEINEFVATETKKIRKEQVTDNQIINTQTDLLNPGLSASDKKKLELDLLAENLAKELEVETLSNEQKLQATAKYNADVFNVNSEYAQKDRELKQSQEDAEQKLQDTKVAIANVGLETLGSLFGKNKAIADALFAIEKGLAIGQIITSSSKAIAQATANLASVPAVIGIVPNPAYAIQAAATAKAIASTKLSAALGLATIAGASVTRFMSGAGASTPTAPTAVNYNQAPIINSTNNSTGDGNVQNVRIIDQKPIPAYITSKAIKDTNDEEAFYSRIGSV